MAGKSYAQMPAMQTVISDHQAVKDLEVCCMFVSHQGMFAKKKLGNAVCVYVYTCLSLSPSPPLCLPSLSLPLSLSLSCLHFRPTVQEDGGDIIYVVMIVCAIVVDTNILFRKGMWVVKGRRDIWQGGDLNSKPLNSKYVQKCQLVCIGQLACLVVAVGFLAVLDYVYRTNNVPYLGKFFGW